MANILITGGAGFIGYHLQHKLLSKHQVNAIDLILNPTPAIALRLANLQRITNANIQSNFLSELKTRPDVVVHLAAETGIAGSLTNPDLYLNTNVAGTFNVLEQCRKNGVKFLIYASSSSVYAPNQKVMHEDGDTENQLSFYGTTKKMGEVMVENYCKQFGITAIGLRFFTVYGSYTRPDMAAYKFMHAIKSGNPVTLYNDGNVMRDFTHVSDVVKSIELLIEKVVDEPEGNHLLFNIGYGAPVSVKEYAHQIAYELEKQVTFEDKPLPKNELVSTHSNTSKLAAYIGYNPKCTLEQGVKEMVNWFKVNAYE
ncbi:MAG: NAD-dependent epimerase/dehydratase family protein [Bacteroidia bacterium]